ncbi:MAG: SsrA-binding protein SmpB [Candidatus Gracilibacteria bacterium]|nr:SsrA-binding protein SmpB [Candidatus Gracilibacteria bacterium]
MPSLAKNKKAFHDYEILEEYEAGVMLLGTEVKSVRKGDVSLKGGFVTEHGAELLLTNVHIGAYKPAAQNNHEPLRSRKLLLKKVEVNKIIGKLSQKGVSCVPLEFYTKASHIKLRIAIVKGKKLYDKKRDKKEKDIRRDAARELRGRKRG